MRYFHGKKRKGKLKDVIDCPTNGRCNRGECGACGLQRLFLRVFESQTAQADEVSVWLQKDGEAREFSLRMRATLLDKNYCLALVENVYERELQRELTTAQTIQQRLLPAGKEAGGVKYAYTYVPCREIGGDLPDVYELNFGSVKNTFGVIADVSGKGIAAGMLSSFVKAGLDRSEPSPAKAIGKLSAKFKELNLDERSYITVAATRIDAQANRLYYCIAGHNAPILLKSGEGVNEIEMAAPPVSNWFDGFPYADEVIGYNKGDILVLLTDGVTESKNPEGEQFGLERVEEILLQCASANQFIERLQIALKDFCGIFDDDITAIAFDL